MELTRTERILRADIAAFAGRAAIRAAAAGMGSDFGSARPSCNAFGAGGRRGSTSSIGGAAGDRTFKMHRHSLSLPTEDLPRIGSQGSSRGVGLLSNGPCSDYEGESDDEPASATLLRSQSTQICQGIDEGDDEQGSCEEGRRVDGDGGSESCGDKSIFCEHCNGVEGNADERMSNTGSRSDDSDGRGEDGDGLGGSAHAVDGCTRGGRVVVRLKVRRGSLQSQRASTTSEQVYKCDSLWVGDTE